MNVRFYQDLLFEEELLEEKSNVVQENIKVQEKNPILAQDENEPNLSVDQTRAIDEDFLKTPIQADASLASYLKEAIEVQVHDQIDEAMEIQV